jgi:peptidoglycan/LPS O-acetylase OafA/YrhL
MADAGARVEPSVAPPPGELRFPLVDAVRALAALMVFTIHAVFFAKATDTTLGEIAGRFDVSLTMFMVISGFLMYRPFASARIEDRRLPNVRDYTRRRALRIVPAFWVALLVLSIYPGLAQMDTGHWWVFPAFLQNYSLGWVHGGIPVAWSLCVEVAFYVSLPLVAFGARRLWGRTREQRVRSEFLLLGALVLISIGWRVMLVLVDYGPAGEGTPNVIQAAPFVIVPGTLETTVIGMYDWMAFGMAIAVASVALQGRARQPGIVRSIERWPGLWLLAAAGLFAFATQVWPAPPLPEAWTNKERFMMHEIYAICAAMVLLPAVFGGERRGPVRGVMRNRALARLGVISYAFYLYHLTIMLEVLQHIPDGMRDHAVLWIYLTALPITTAVAALSYYLVERPLLRLKFRGRQARGAPA